MYSKLASVFLVALSLARFCNAQDPVFSGPQVGEKLGTFKVRGVLDDAAGKEFDFVALADGKPIVLIFIHEVNRPALGMARILATYTASRAKDGLATGVVWLADDGTEAEAQIKRSRGGLAKNAPLGISIDGREGPGSYGLNRNVALTILVGKENKVTANFALVQPSLQADLPKILDAVVAVAGGKAPKLDELEGMQGMARREAGAASVPDVGSLLRPVIRPNATSEEVDAAAKKVEEAAAKDEAFKKEIARITSVIKIETYGTPKAREYLKKWKEEYSPKPTEKKPEEKPGDKK